jgi:peroxiredoxin
MPEDIYDIPSDLPIPTDDGGVRHLCGRLMPPVPLPATMGGTRTPQQGDAGRTLIVFFPYAGRPDQPLLPGWNQIPGARGCTPELVGFQQLAEAFRAIGVGLAGLSTQTPAELLEVAQRLRLSFPLFSDAALTLTRSLHLPTFQVAGRTMIKRLSVVVRQDRIEHCFYPIFPPGEHAAQALRWLIGYRGGAPVN